MSGAASDMGLTRAERHKMSLSPETIIAPLHPGESEELGNLPSLSLPSLSFPLPSPALPSLASPRSRHLKCN